MFKLAVEQYGCSAIHGPCFTKLCKDDYPIIRASPEKISSHNTKSTVLITQCIIRPKVSRFSTTSFWCKKLL